MNPYNKFISKLSSTDEKIQFLEKKLFDQSKSIDELTKTFEKLFSTNKNPRYSNLEELITQNKGTVFYVFKLIC